MRFYIEKNISAGNKRAFEIIKSQAVQKPNSLIGLAVGKTTDGLYKLISKDVKKNPKRWSRLKLFQIDENLGCGPKSNLSFNAEIRKELKELLSVVNPKNIFLIDGSEESKKIISKGYKFLKKNGGIDLIILGIGPEYDPHIAYNTTGKSSLNSRMRVVNLHPRVLDVIARRLEKPTKQSRSNLHKSDWDCHTSLCSARNDIKGITLGIKDILDARKVLLIAYGKEKAKSIKLAFNGKIDTKRVSASALQMHKNLFVITDKEAGKHLRYN